MTKEVTRGSTEVFDTAVVLMMRNPAGVLDPRGMKWLEEMGLDFTALDGVRVLGAADPFAGCFMRMRGLYRTAPFLGSP